MGSDVVGKRGRRTMPDRDGPRMLLSQFHSALHSISSKLTSQNTNNYRFNPSSPPSPMKYSPLDKSASLATAFIGAVSNVALAAYLAGVWRSLAWEPGSEWEGLSFSLSRDGARLVCGLFSAYFAAASAICVFGLVGISRVISFPFLPPCPRDTLLSAYPRLFASTATMSLATLPFALSLPSWHLPQQ